LIKRAAVSSSDRCCDVPLPRMRAEKVIE
jgi:hypothetical protein